MHTDDDFSAYDLDAPVEQVEVPGSQGLFDVARRLSEPDSLTLLSIGRLYAQGILLPQSEIADQIEASFIGGDDRAETSAGDGRRDRVPGRRPRRGRRRTVVVRS